MGNKRVALPDVVRVLQDGCMIVFTSRVVASCCAGALGIRREIFTAVLRRAVVFKLGGFAQPGVKQMEFIVL